MYDVCVVGAGMVGSAAAKWLSMKEGSKVCLIGPQEPTEEEWKAGQRDVFSSHYDEGRIVRELDEDFVWATLAQRSIRRYRDIEKQSGLAFFQEVGCLYIGEQDFSEIQQNVDKMGITDYVEKPHPRELRRDFPFMHVEDDWKCVFQRTNAGYISPRVLVKAQQVIARSRGCEVIRDIAFAVQERRAVGAGESYVCVSCESGLRVDARKVLLCTGAFSNFHDLLPRGKRIDFYPCRTICLKAEVKEEYARELESMPSIHTRLPGRATYMLPPIKYPDGKYYLKIGQNCKGSQLLGLQQMAEWFRGQEVHHAWNDRGLEVIKSFLHDLDPVSVSMLYCASSHTPTDQLYCDMVTPRLGVVMGLTGRGAKSSDEIGRMGASMISKGSWDCDLPAHLFKLRYKDGPNKPGSSKL